MSKASDKCLAFQYALKSLRRERRQHPTNRRNVKPTQQTHLDEYPEFRLDSLPSKTQKEE